MCLVCVVGLDKLIGQRVLLAGADEMLHPVCWTWYAITMLLFNLAKGAALATSRIIYMIFLNFCQVRPCREQLCSDASATFDGEIEQTQFAILDKTTFPKGTEGMDPAFSSYVALVHFTCKYRSPFTTSLFSRHLCQLKRKEEEEIQAEHPGQQVDSRFVSWLTSDVLRRPGLIRVS